MRGGRPLGSIFDNVQLCGFDFEFVDARRYINEMVGVDNRYIILGMCE